MPMPSSPPPARRGSSAEWPAGVSATPAPALTKFGRPIGVFGQMGAQALIKRIKRRFHRFHEQHACFARDGQHAVEFSQTDRRRFFAEHCLAPAHRGHAVGRMDGCAVAI